MFRPITILVVLICGLSSFESANAIDFSFAKWELVKKTDGISVYKWKPANSNLYAAKANGVIFAPLERIASVLADGSRRNEWFPELIETQVIRHISPLLRIEYMSVRTPFPVLNRDFVYTGEVTCKRDLSYMKVRFTSLDDPDVPETDFVRGRFIESSYTLRKLSEYRTFVEIIAMVDPRGFIPTWIVNMVQANVPYNAIANLGRQSAKADIQVVPGLAVLCRDEFQVKDF